MTQQPPYPLTEVLRAEFDEAFARARREEKSSTHGFLIVRIGELRRALPVEDIGGFFRCPPLTVLPSHHHAVVGLAGIGGALVVVYDGGLLLGRAPVRTNKGWLVILREDRTCAILCDEQLGYVVVSRDNIQSAPGRSGNEEPARALLVDGKDPMKIAGARDLIRAITLPAASATRSET